MVLELASLEKKKENDFFKIRFLGFYKPELADILVLYSGWSRLSEDLLVGFRLSFHALSPLLLSKRTFQPPSEIATAISDNPATTHHPAPKSKPTGMGYNFLLNKT